MPVIHDQPLNADRLEYMDLGPPSLSREVLFPNTAVVKNSVENIVIRDAGAQQPATGERPAVVSEEEKELQAAVQTAVNLLDSRLRAVSAASMRLRCASFGRDLMSDVQENGLKNTCDIIVRELQVGAPELVMNEALKIQQGDRPSDTSTSREGNNRDAMDANSTECTRDEGNDERKGGGRGVGKDEGRERCDGGEEEIDNEEGSEWEEFDSGLCLATHALTSPQETAFLHQEIFMERGYMQHGIQLRENDLVIDVGRSECSIVLILSFQFRDSLRAPPEAQHCF